MPINKLAALTSAHKDFFKKLVVASITEIANMPAELPEHERSEKGIALSGKLNGHLISQESFYQAREQWIEAASAICNLVQACRETAKFGEFIEFSDDDEANEFDRQMALVEEAHLLEVELLNERLKRLAESIVNRPGFRGGHLV